MAARLGYIPANVRKAVSKVTEKIFINPDSYVGYYRYKTFRKGNEYISSLPLQMAFYFNSMFFPLWFIACFVTYNAKYDKLDALYKIIIFAVLLMMAVVEAIRLYLGYIGNLTEKVPELAGSWLLTILLQCPLSLFLLLNEDLIVLPLERAMHIVLCTFILFEIVFGCVAVKNLVNHQVALFHMQQFTKADDLEKVHKKKESKKPAIRHTNTPDKRHQREGSPSRLDRKHK